MMRVLHRLRSGRIGVIGLVLLILLVLVLAHSLIMGAGHDAGAACGPCVVVIVTGLAAAVALIGHRSGPTPVRSGFWTVHPLSSRGGVGLTPWPRSTVLRL